MKFFQTSIFSEYLANLLKFSLKIDAGIYFVDDFVKLQRSEARVINARNDGYINYTEYKALYSIASELHKQYRIVLKLDR